MKGMAVVYALSAAVLAALAFAVGISALAICHAAAPLTRLNTWRTRHSRRAARIR